MRSKSPSHGEIRDDSSSGQARNKDISCFFLLLAGNPISVTDPNMFEFFFMMSQTFLGL